jgi:Transposase DDE domain group 1
VPEQPIGELKNGLQADRLSACGFCANSWRLLVAVVAYALVVLFREANAEVEEVATAQVGTLRQRLWKVTARVVVGGKRIGIHLSSLWPGQELWGRVQEAVRRFVREVEASQGEARPACGVVVM